MSTITKERLIKIQQWRETYGPGSNVVLPAEEAEELARIALASLEAEAVCVIDQSNLDYLKSGSDADVWPASRTEMGDVLLYRSAPPAPVSVPDERPSLNNGIVGFDEGWNACRAAMLQGADGTLTDEGTKRVDELVMWIKRLAHSLRKSNPDSKLQSDAMDYLSRKGLIGVKDILR